MFLWPGLAAAVFLLAASSATAQVTISDQLTGAFANSLDVAVVQTAEVITGNVPAEFGSKVFGPPLELPHDLNRLDEFTSS